MEFESEWETYDEPYKVTYPEDVSVQREKDSSIYSVKAVLEIDGCLSPLLQKQIVGF
jgi:hypothetical protein